MTSATSCQMVQKETVCVWMWLGRTPVCGGKDDKANGEKRCNTFVTLGRRYTVMLSTVPTGFL